MKDMRMLIVRPCSVRVTNPPRLGPVPQLVHQPRKLIELHEPAAVRVVLREDPGRLGRRHVDSEGVQAVAQLAVVEPACSRLGRGVRAGLG